MSGAPVSVGDALGRFAVAYGSTGHELPRTALELVDETGRALGADAILPCGLPAGADAFVRSSAPPKALSGDAAAVAAAAAAAAVAAVAAGEPAPPSKAEDAAQKDVYARSGSAIAGGVRLLRQSPGSGSALSPRPPQRLRRSTAKTPPAALVLATQCGLRH